MAEPSDKFKLVKSVAPEGHTEMVYANRPKNLAELLQSTVKKYGNHEAFADLDNRLSYRQADTAIDNMASALNYRYGIGKGDRVALMLRNGIEFALSLFALAETGVITVPLNTALKGEELAFQVKDCGASLVVTDHEFYDLMDKASTGVDSVKQIFVTGDDIPDGATSFSHLLESNDYPPVEADIGEDDIAVLMYTSGTTGKPKGALLSHKGIIASAMNAARLCDLHIERDRMLVVAPLFHITGLAMNLCSAVFTGIPSIFIKRFKTEDTLRIIEAEKITTMFAVPTILWLMFNAPDFERYDFSLLRVMASGGSASPEDLLKCSAGKLPDARLLPGYGLTEACGMVHSTTSLEEALNKPGSSGRPLPNIEAKVVDNNGEDLPPGQAGELLVRGCQVMRGYWNNPDASLQTVVDGWLHTGDIAMITKEGDTYILDRLKDMIIRGGENIYSLEVENALYRHPKVLEAAVVGVPDPIFGEQVKAVLVLRPGEQATEEEIQEFCDKYLARYKVPKHVEFREALPRNPAGKLLKGDL